MSRLEKHKVNFLIKAKNKFKDKFDYSKVEYVNNRTKVIIKCPIHGEFQQTPAKHLIGKYGCPKCGLPKLKSKEKFIEEASFTHNNKYDYSKVEYKGNHKKITIICPIHGEFLQAPNDHLHGQGCPHCGRIRTVNSKRDTQKTFIHKALKIHNGIYDYSKVHYKDTYTPVVIICKEHGEFQQTPNSHLQGQGCPHCRGKNISLNRRDSLQTFIKKANKTHNNKFNYSKVEYVNSKTKVCIICPKHGEFWQYPNQHVGGSGCPICKESHLEREMRNFLTENNIEFESQKRFKGLKMQSVDFYLPRYNIAIECQGRQHFEKVPFSSKNNDLLFEETIKRDIKKNKICKELGIDLIYYTTINLKPFNIDSNGLFNGIYKENNVFVHLEEIIDYIKAK